MGDGSPCRAGGENGLNPKYGQKTILKWMEKHLHQKIGNPSCRRISSGRKGKVVGQETRWIIGGMKERPPLAPDAKITFNFVVNTKTIRKDQGDRHKTFWKRSTCNIEKGVLIESHRKKSVKRITASTL